MSETPTAPQDTKKCPTCGNSIPIAAQLCTHCKSYQGWRRIFGFSTTTLALMTALISVSTTAAPVILGLIRGDNSNITVSYQGIYRDQAIKLVAFNSGNRPATIGSVWLGAIKFDAAARPTTTRLVELGVNDPENIDFKVVSIGPGEANYNLYYLGPKNKENLTSFVFDGTKNDCFVRFGWIDFATTQARYKDFPFDCVRIPILQTERPVPLQPR